MFFFGGDEIRLQLDRPKNFGRNKIDFCPKATGITSKTDIFDSKLLTV